jgi:16S rRNA (uracil1498-N3)-methyltransferase
VNIFIGSVQNNKALLTPEESWHCAKVLRKKKGDVIQLIDGKGNFFEGIISVVSEKQCAVDITKGPMHQTKRDYYLHLAIAPTKQIDRVEWMLEKAVEIGIDEISFIECKNSERTVVKMDRMAKIIESAVKQSLQAFIPKINDLQSFRNCVTTSTCTHKLIAHCFDTQKTNIKAIDFKNTSSVILIGPEGDFTKEEVEISMKMDFKAISLGKNRLRTETAGLYACQAVSILN